MKHVFGSHLELCCTTDNFLKASLTSALRVLRCFLSPPQKLAVLKDGFQLDSGSQQELWSSSPSLNDPEPSVPPLYSDAGSQTDVPAEVRVPVSSVSVSRLQSV